MSYEGLPRTIQVQQQLGNACRVSNGFGQLGVRCLHIKLSAIPRGDENLLEDFRSVGWGEIGGMFRNRTGHLFWYASRL